MTSDIAGFKLKFIEKNHQPDFYPKNTNLHGSIIDPSIPPDTSIILGERGKKNFEPRYDVEVDIKPGKKHVSHKEYADEIEKRGKKFLPPPQPKSDDLLEISYPERSHFEERMGKKLPSTHITADWRRKKTIITANANKEPPNYDIESIMNRKQRVTSEERKRNDVGVATGGDKPYKEVNHETDFYKKGGLIPGSSIGLKTSGKPTMKKPSDSTKGVNSKKLEATYSKYMERLEKKYEVSQVHTLTKSSMSNQGETVPSWEQRTGQHLTDPDDDSVY